MRNNEIVCPKCGSKKYTMEKCINGYIQCSDCGFKARANEYNGYKDLLGKILFVDEYDPDKVICEYKDYIAVNGGDGSLLKAINKYRHLNKPFFGIAGGTVNFLMNTSNKISEKAKHKTFNLIKVRVTYKAPNQLGNIIDKIDEFQAFNEIFISEENGWIDFSCHDQDYILGKFKGSGLIISTPQGSTGVNKNNNGVILPLSSKDWSITGDKTNRKINYVLAQKPMSVTVKSRGEVNLFLDGHNKKIKNVTRVEIMKGDKVTIIFNSYKDFKRKRTI